MACEEVVEAKGHLIDSHVMEQIFDKVVESSGRFEVEQFRIGRTNGEPSYLRLRIETPDAHSRWSICSRNCSSWAARRSDTGDAVLRPVERDRCAPEDFYSTSNHHTFVRIGGDWVEVRNQRMDAMIVVKGSRRGVPPTAGSESGRHGGLRYARHSRRARNRRSATDLRLPSCRTRSPPNGRWRPPSGKQRRWRGRRREQGKTIVAVAGPVVVHTGGEFGLARLIRGRLDQCGPQRQCARRARY